MRFVHSEPTPLSSFDQGSTVAAPDLRVTLVSSLSCRRSVRGKFGETWQFRLFRQTFVPLRQGRYFPAPTARTAKPDCTIPCRNVNSLFQRDRLKVAIFRIIVTARWIF